MTTNKSVIGMMFWHRKISADTLRPRADVEAALDVAGMEHRDLAESQFIGRALQQTNKDMKIARIPKKYQTNPDESLFQISEEFFDGYWLKREGRDMITYNSKTGVLVCDDKVRPVLEAAILEQKDQYTEGDLRAIIKAMLEETNQIKSKDAVWFIPQSKRAELQRLLTFMDTVKLPYHLYELNNDPDTVAQVSKDAEDDIQGNLKLLQDAVRKLVENGTGAPAALGQVKSLMGRCKFYREMLQCKTEDVEKEIEECTEKIQQALAIKDKKKRVDPSTIITAKSKWQIEREKEDSLVEPEENSFDEEQDDV